jgi:RPA family protein
MLAGIVTDIEDVGDDQAYLRMRCTDIAGNNFNVYAGQYQKEARNVVQQLEAPEWVQVIGKANTLENDDGGVFTSVRPETVNTLSESEFFRLSAECAQHTVKRLTGEYGHEFFDEQAADLYDSDLTEDIYEAALDTLEEVAEAVGDESAENKLSREELEQMEYDELRGLAKKFENVNGSATADAIIDALSDKPAPA